MKKTLGDIAVGEEGTVEKIELPMEIKRRLLDIGVVNDTKIRCLFSSPWGDPRAYLIRGAVIAIRSEEAGGVFLV